MVHLFYSNACGRLTSPVFDQLAAGLPRSIQDRIQRFHLQEDAQRSLLGWSLLKEGLQCLGYDKTLHELEYTSFGRPCLQQPFDFNITHAGNYALCAISQTRRVGVDIEKVRNIHLEDFRSALSIEEWHRIQQASDTLEAFFIAWTKKESLLKALGVGLHKDPIAVCTEEDCITIDDREWYWHCLEFDPWYIAHLACDGAKTAIQMHCVTF